MWQVDSQGFKVRGQLPGAEGSGAVVNRTVRPPRSCGDAPPEKVQVAGAMWVSRLHGNNCGELPFAQRCLLAQAVLGNEDTARGGRQLMAQIQKQEPGDPAESPERRW